MWKKPVLFAAVRAKCLLKSVEWTRQTGSLHFSKRRQKSKSLGRTGTPAVYKTVWIKNNPVRTI